MVTLCFVVSWRALFNSQPFSKGQITREYLYLKHFPQETAGIQTDKSTKTPPESEAAVAPSPLEGPALLCPARNSVSLPDQAAGQEVHVPVAFLQALRHELDTTQMDEC